MSSDIRKYFPSVADKRTKAPPPARVMHLNDTAWIETGTLPSDLVFDFDTLWALHPEEYGVVRIAGRTIETPRWQQSYARPYWFSGVMHEALPLPPELEPFLEWANGMNGKFGYNQVLVNWYVDGSHYIGAHSDDERQIVPSSPIASVSLGATRTFRVRAKDTGKVATEVVMTDRSYMVMGGTMQRDFTHEVPKIGGARGAATGKRINVTFRVFS